jgi:hypothetical protein
MVQAPSSPVEPRARGAEARWRPSCAFGACAVASALVGVAAVRAILAQAGEPALPLDDAFIHLQYARRLAEGHFFSYAPGEGYTAGATSVLWPLLFAPAFVLGVRELDVVWLAWLAGGIAHALTALETGRLAAPLVGRVGAAGAAAMCLAFGAFAWFSFSGMETVALALVLVHAARLASDYCERRYVSRRSIEARLMAVALLAPLVRPEGLIASLSVATAFSRASVGARAAPVRAIALAAAALAAPGLAPVMHRIGTGHAASTTAMVKWLPLDPYRQDGGWLADAVDNAKLLLTDLLNGGPWTVIFVPQGFAWLLAVGLGAAALATVRARCWWRGALIAVLVCGTLLPCTYGTMLWNRVRYIWPFAPAWFVLASAAAVELARVGARFALAIGPRLGARAGRLDRLVGMGAAALVGGVVAQLAGKLPWAIADLAESARAIARQQVTLGRWAAGALPSEARIGVNDTGAIAYLSGRRTFDVVGLTTEGEARYWTAGPGARFEHYERMPRDALPTHFIVYPEWMALDAVLGAPLVEATVLEQSILGGVTMIAYEAEWSLLGTGARPVARSDGWGELVAELDVADLESERPFGYVLGSDARSHYCIATVGARPDGGVLADGGRIERAEDRFRLGPLEATRMVMRVSSRAPLEIWLGGMRIGEATALAETGQWQELAVDLPPLASPVVVVVRAVRPLRFASYHYWWFAR